MTAIHSRYVPPSLRTLAHPPAFDLRTPSASEARSLMRSLSSVRLTPSDPTWWEEAPTMAAARLLEGWAGIALPFSKGLGRMVNLETMDALANELSLIEMRAGFADVGRAYRELTLEALRRVDRALGDTR